jgi:hypothetical protein
MKTPHKHAELIHAWADGAEIEYFSNADCKWCCITVPNWADNVEYRIKPEPKPDAVEYLFAKRDGAETSIKWKISGCDSQNLKLTFDGETGKLKSAEVL